jgi:hypothetical protein
MIYRCIRQAATLVEMEKLDGVEESARLLRTERPYSEPGIYLGTSSFTAAGWEGSFYPTGMQSRDFLSYYATRFAMVEVDAIHGAAARFNGGLYALPIYVCISIVGVLPASDLLPRE